MVKFDILSDREEWLKHRTSTIGGSDAACILGLNKYCSNVDLYEQKKGIVEPADLSDNEYVQFGVSAEPLMREMFKLDYPEYEVLYVENNIWHNDKYPFAHASLDGWLKHRETGDMGIFENKTVNIQNSAQMLEWKDCIPNNYYCQLLHYMAVTEFTFAILKARLRWEQSAGREVYAQIRHYRVDRQDVEDDIQMLMDAEKEFHDRLKNNNPPARILPNI